MSRGSLCVRRDVTHTSIGKRAVGLQLKAFFTEEFVCVASPNKSVSTSLWFSCSQSELSVQCRTVGDRSSNTLQEEQSVLADP